MEDGQGKKVLITLLGRGAPIEFEYSNEISLMEAMLCQGIYFSAACGGRGTCGKCKIQILEGNLEITPEDKRKLTESELRQGYRLSCRAYPVQNCTIRLAASDEADFEVVAEPGQVQSILESMQDEEYGIAIDIGTTTIAVSLVGLTSRNILHTFTTINKQRAYGADVISRMKASNEGKKLILQESIQKDLLEGIQKVVEDTKVNKDKIKKIAIAGNTTMGHLLMGFSCETLGIYPFTPVDISTIIRPFAQVLGSDYLNIPVVILPGISTFVGGDIMAGLYACNFDQADRPSLLIDLGTNGEMAIGNKNRILVSSTAAGPAFEGGNISCGVGSIAGAICNINLEQDKLTYKTIGQMAPVGVCGTGVIEMTSELFKAGLVDETGLLSEEYFDDGFEITKTTDGNAIVFTQKDIREIQLAKSAIRAGAETLIKHFGITYEDIDMVYLAGGFGYKLNLEKAVNIGLLPKELSGKLKAVGNSALGGAIKYLLEADATERIDGILKGSGEIHLSNDKDFNELYIEHMFF